MKQLRTFFLAGLLTLVPVLATWLVVSWLFRLLDGWMARWVTLALGRPVPGLGLAATLTVIILTGFAATNYFGRRAISFGETLIARTPLIRSVYQTVKQITDAFARHDTATFKRVALIEYPRKGVWAVAFTTGAAGGEIAARTQTDLVSVFLPTTPNPTSGFLLMVPREEIVFLSMPVEEGLKLVISGGMLSAGGVRGGTVRPAVASDRAEESA
ncbi:MAG: DUF502 domain-containing protein [bacterium]|nr:DUF502 domain-containing protein [bacterium]